MSKTENHIGINLAADVTAFHSYGESSRQIANALLAAGIPFVINDVASRLPTPLLEKIYQALEQLVVYRSRNDPTMIRFIAEGNPHAVNIVQLWPMVSQRFYASNPAYFRERKNVAMWAWEWAEFPQEWRSYFRPYDEIWTTSEFVREALSKPSPIPVRTQTPPLAIDESSLNASFARQRFGLKRSTCLFLFAWHALGPAGPGTLSFERKNSVAVLRAFRGAFTQADDVALIVKAPPLVPGGIKNLKSYVEAYLRKNARASRRSNFIILQDHLSRTGLMSLISSCDCFVSLHRAEGFGQLLAEAMYLGKPVIATGYSGNLDFMNNGNSLLVKHRLVPMGRFVTQKTYLPPSSENYTWAEPDVEHASEMMRWIYEHREEASRLGKRASEDVRKLMNPLRVGEEIRKKCANLMQG